jgi:hypothetical protein
VHDDVWYEAAMPLDQMISRWAAIMREGIEVLGSDTAAGVRMDETLAYFEFLQAEVPAVLERWRQRKAELQRGQDEKKASRG